MPTILVTAATGKLGAGVVSCLLQLPGFKVRALTRSASSAAAKSLTSRGVEVMEGNYANAESLAIALTGCDGLYLNVVPWSETAEEDDARAVLDAARAAGTVKQIVYSSVLAADWMDRATPDEIERLLPAGQVDPFWRRYWQAKGNIEHLVREAGFLHWTILRPALFLHCFLPGSHGIAPIVPNYDPAQDVAHVRLPFDPHTTPIAVVDPADVGKYAAAAFTNPEAWHGRTADVAVENLNVPRVYAAMEAVSGKKLVVSKLSDEEVAEARAKNMVVDGILFWSKYHVTGDMNQIKKDNLGLTTVDEFFKSNKEEVVGIFKEQEAFDRQIVK